MRRLQIKLNYNKSNQMLVFGEREKPEYPGKNFSDNNKLSPLRTAGYIRKSNPGQVGGRRVL